MNHSSSLPKSGNPRSYPFAIMSPFGSISNLIFGRGLGGGPAKTDPSFGLNLAP